MTSSNKKATRSTRGTRSATLLIACVLSSPVSGQAQPTVDEIARNVIIGQAYPSGNVYVAGFIEDEPRPWPRRIVGVPLDADRTGRITADFFRIVAQDSEEHYYFPQREADTFEEDVFATIDRMAIVDRNLARYRASAPSDKSVSFFAWDDRWELVDVSHRSRGQARPVTEAERKQVAADRSKLPKETECTTVPQFLDDAKIILTANVANTKLSIRLSKYSTPGCAGHLADIYVLDVMEPGRDQRRFEFHHYQGLL